MLGQSLQRWHHNACRRTPHYLSLIDMAEQWHWHSNVQACFSLLCYRLLLRPRKELLCQRVVRSVERLKETNSQYIVVFSSASRYRQSHLSNMRHQQPSQREEEQWQAGLFKDNESISYVRFFFFF